MRKLSCSEVRRARRDTTDIRQPLGTIRFPVRLPVKAFGEGGPGGVVVVFAGGADEGGFVDDRAFAGTAGEGVVDDGAGDGGVSGRSRMSSQRMEMPVRWRWGVWKV